MAKIVKVLDSFHVNQYAVLIVDDIFKVNSNKIRIDEEVYDIETVSDIPNAIAVKSNKDFIGKEGVII